MWHLRLICCGRDDGTMVFSAWDEAQAFRESYTSGPAIAVHGFSSEPRESGHRRAAILTESD